MRAAVNLAVAIVHTGSARGWLRRNLRPAAARSGAEKRWSGGGSGRGLKLTLGRTLVLLVAVAVAAAARVEDRAVILR